MIKATLAVDIGNTNISFGIFSQNKLIKKFDIPTLSFNLKELKPHLAKENIRSAIICSVVPKATLLVKQSLKEFTSKKPLITGENIKVPIKNLYRKPKQVGQDRLVNAYAGVKFYGSPLIVIDFGTAITFDVVSRKNEYLGGMILPGLGMSLDALNRKTALIPRVNLNPPKEFIGKDTESSVLSGIIYGVAALTDELVKKIREEIGGDAVVVATGSSAKLISKYCHAFSSIDTELTLKGLNLLLK